MTALPRDVIWVGSSREDLRAFPEEVRQSMGFAIFQAQNGGKYVTAKPLRGFRGAGVVEVVEDHDGGTFRTVYTVRYSDALYVLHAFQKKSKRGMATPKRDMDLVRVRLKMAQQIHDGRVDQKGGRST